MRVDNVLTIALTGALIFMVVRMALAKLAEPDRSHFPWIAIGVCGIVFCVVRVIHHGTSDPALALRMIRAQYATGFLLPALAVMTVESVAEIPRSRASIVIWVSSLVIFVGFLFTPWFVSGPVIVREDLIGQSFFAAQPGPGLWLVLPLGVYLTVVLRRTLTAMPPRLAPLRRTLRIAIIAALLLGANDTLQGAGAFPSMPVFEWAFLLIAFIAVQVELQRQLIVRAQLRALVDERGRDVEQKRATIDYALRKLTRSEERYRHLAQATREGVILLEGRSIIDVNHAVVHMLGVAEADLLGAVVTDLFDPSEAATVEKLLSGEQTESIDLHARKGDRQLAVSVKATSVPEGATGTRVLLVRDISGERELRLQLLRADRLAAVGTLAAGTAHEINNPLVYVVGNAEMLQQELERLAPMLPPGELDLAKEIVGEIGIGGDRVRKIVKDLMALARDRSTDESAIDVRRVLETSLAMAHSQLRHRATVVRDFADVPRVFASEVRLGQVFLNLLVNAAQAIPEGRAAENEVRIRTRVDGETVIVEIEDTGAGMDARTRDRIFDPFFTTKDVGQGTGLGLSISHGIITTLGGRIDVASEIGKGSTFRVVLPAMPAEPEVTSATLAASETTPTKRILVIDDEELVARNLARMLSPHSVDVANTGREALDLWQAGRGAKQGYDVVLCDLMMPDITGMELYTQLVAADPKTAAKFLFMTGGAFTEKAREFLDNSSTRCLEKPISKADLHRAVADVITSAR